MAVKNEFELVLNKRKPIFAYNPPGILKIDLLREVIKAGGIGLVNLERLKITEAKKILLKCFNNFHGFWGLRIANKEQLDLAIQMNNSAEPVFLIIGDLELDEKQLKLIQARSFIIIAEVVSLKEAYDKKWATTYLVKGNEAAGRIGDETSFILAQQFADAGLPFILQGGIGLYTSASILAIGAKGLVLDTQLYQTPECPLSDEVKEFLSKIDATDTKILGDSTKKKYRVYARLGTRIVKEFLQKEQDLLSKTQKERTEQFNKELMSQREMYDSTNISNNLLPMGQDIPFAKILTNQFQTVKGIIDGLVNQIQEQVKVAQESYPFEKNNSVAKELGIDYPIIQGPMANVSESPEFAKIVADNGALPFLALGSLFQNQTRTLIKNTKKELGSAPFGCGIIGLEANKNARDRHLAIIKDLKPPYVVVAAGTIDQAKQVMRYGIETFLHTPSPALFKEAIEAGVRNLVLEGMECGGHIGVLTSYVLWELSLHKLKSLSKIIKQSKKKIRVCFAGGIGDRFSAASVGLVASALPELMDGILWVGTAYILAKEMVGSGAIQPLYQQLALNAKETMVLGETVNTRARSIPTPFAREIIKRELERIKEGISLKERKHQYERDNLGATRIAALGEIWNPDGEDDKPNRFMPIDEKGQYKKGNYLIGQIVASLRCIRSVDQIHSELIEKSKEVVRAKSSGLLNYLNQTVITKEYPVIKQPTIQTSIEQSVEIDTSAFESEGIAIVGLGCVMPDAPNIDTYWNNIKNRVNSIREIPPERWSGKIDLFYDEDRSAPNKSYVKIAAAIRDFQFNSLKFKIPPKVAQNMGRSQQMSLVAAKEALKDAGLLAKGVDNSKTAVIVGNAMGDEIRVSHTRKIFLPEVLSSIESSPDFQHLNTSKWEALKKKLIAKYDDALVPINEDAMPGELSNVIAGRIANIFNLRGKNMTTDAACASSLAAINVAVKALLDKECNAVVCGGADCSLDPTTFVKFAKIGALSAEGSYPFDKRANGFVMGEGAGFLVLKRLSDAIKDGNKIYAVIRGLGASSDGKGKGITAPNPIGQKLAIQRALDQAKIDFNNVQLVEAHGTSTSVGDVVELQVLNDLANNLKPQQIAIGSIKSQIGHLKSAAGIAAIIKTVLALHHKVLPPSINVQQLNPKLDWEKSAFYVNKEMKNWEQPASGTRIAGVSSFGFGGTNYHAILEEYIPGKTKGHLPTLIDSEELKKVIAGSQIARTALQRTSFEFEFDQEKWNNYIEKNLSLEIEPLFFGAKTNNELIEKIISYKSNLPKSDYIRSGEGKRIRDLSLESQSELKEKTRVSLTAKSLDELPEALEALIEGIKDVKRRKMLQNKGMFFSEDHKIGKIAFLFPGQGSQYVRMGKVLWDKYEIVRKTYEEADKITKELIGFPISEVIFALSKTDAEAKEMLRQTEITQPAIFTLNIALFRLLKKFGVEPDYVAGHSLGEYAALVASGILSLRDGFMAVVPRGQAMNKYKTKDKGTMASIGAGSEEVEKILESIDGYVIAANKNSPKQTVISGSTVAVKQAVELFNKKGITAIPLPVSGAFHSKIVEPAVEEFKIALEKLTYNKPTTPITSNVTGELYPKTRKEIISLLLKQICSPVEWMKQVRRMYNDFGVRTFIEIGPKYVLTSFTRAILEVEDDVLALASNHPKRGEIQHFSEVIGALGTFGYNISFPDKDSQIFTENFLNPRQQCLVKKEIHYEPSTQAVFKESPFDVLLKQDLENLSQENDFKDYLELQAPAISAFLKAGYDTYRTTIAAAVKQKKELDKLEINTEAIGVTGVSIGLPGKNRKVFDESNFEAILSGENFIDLIPDEIKDKMVDKNIVRLVKDAIKGAQFQTINDASEVIKLAAQKGEFDLHKEYGVDASFSQLLDVTFQLAFAAGIEAMRDAGIPLMPLKVKTSVGKEISKGWALPESMRNDTGIVFASAFPAYSNLIATLSDYLSDKYAAKNLQETEALFEQLINQIKSKSAQERIASWYKENKKSLQVDKESKFQFSRKFLFEILSMGHSQFAQFIRARGPNTQVNAACSSTTQAIAIAEDWIRTGRCNRVIVIGADDVTNKEMMEWIGSGFLAVGAATTKKDVTKAALPFDKRRHGMIIGMGAVGLVLESESAITNRGIKPIVDLLGTHIVNSAFHGTRLDRDHISSQMNEFISKIEKRFNISREEIANELVFVSHETYTPARGGSASAEVDALRKTFGEKTDKIVIANTKGFTGHAMGAGIEDVVAVKILESGIVPPVANWKEQDPELGYLNLSKGGHYPVKYALRFAAGFGSQLTLALFRLNTPSGRFESPNYEQWLNTIGGSLKTLEVENKTLRLTEDPSVIKPKIEQPKIRPASSPVVNKDYVKTITALISEKTGYPVDMIEPDMQLEEDLGIDTVKQAELFGIIRTKYDLPREEGVRIQDYYSVNKIAEYIASKIGGSAPAETSNEIMVNGKKVSKEIVRKEIIQLISEKTGYPTDMIEPEMELEEDLGIDTVKQAEIFGIIRTKWNLPREEGIRIQEYSTVVKITDYIMNRLQSGSTAAGKDSPDILGSATDIEVVPIKRQTVQFIKAPLFPGSKAKLSSKHIIVFGDKKEFSTELLKQLDDKKANIQFVANKKIAKFLETYSPEEEFDGFIYIMPKTTKKNKHDITVRALFDVVKKVKFVKQPVILLIENSTKLFGWKGKAAPIIGSLTGFAKTLSREFTASKVKVISASEPSQIIDELVKDDGSVEVAYDSKGNRFVPITSESSIDESKEPLFVANSDDLIVITGGAQGITYQITKKIAEKYQPKLALIGRTELPANIDEIAALSEEELVEKKNRLIAKYKDQGIKLTPVQIEREWSKTIKAVNVKKALIELESLGSEVEYYSVDVRETEKVKTILDKIKTNFGTEITGLIHGAGIEVSKLIKDKKVDDFNRIYDVKALGFDNLIDNIDLKSLKFVSCFSSVAGRYGNAGQVDYSAANDYLSKYCWRLTKQNIRAFSICWSAWDEVGMATRGSILQILKMAGITPIQIDDGVKAFVDELEYGQEPEVVISGNLGLLLESPNSFVPLDKKKYPLLGAAKRNLDGSISIKREFSLDNDLYLDHHRFDNIPYLPGVMGLELFAQLAKLAYPKLHLAGYTDVEFKSAIKFHQDKSRVLKGRISFAKEPEAMLYSEITKDGRIIGKPNVHFHSKISLSKKRIEQKTTKPKTFRDSLGNKALIYSILPHGSRFQVLKKINTIDDEISTNIGSITQKQFKWKTSEFIAQPLLIESGFQTMGLFDIIKDKKLGLPFGIEELEFFETDEMPKFVKGAKIEDTDFGSKYQFEVLTKTGQLIMRASGYKTVKVDFGANFDGVEQIHLNRIKRLFKSSTKAIVEVISVQDLESKVALKPDYLNDYLHPDELQKLESFKIAKRRNEWMSGVFAVKSALKALNPKLTLNKLKVEKTEFGKPFVKLPKNKEINVSITHSNGFAVGIIDSKEIIGIDLEYIEDRANSLVDELLSKPDRDLLEEQKKEISKELVTKIWTAKEAVTKVLGIGLNIDLHDILLHKISDKEIVMNVDTKKLPKLDKLVASKLKGKETVEFKAKIQQNDEFVAATCHLKT